jgi:hypothetical protein
MSAPAGKAWFGDAIGGRDEAEDVPAERRWIIGRFADEATTFPDWVVEDHGIEVRLTVQERVPDRTVIGWSAAGKDGTVTFTVDPSGWILAVAAYGGKEIGRGYVSHVYEWYEIYPPGATPTKDEESPGHFGKRLDWVGLSTEAWPVLKTILPDIGGFTVSVDESKLRQR